MGLAMFFVYISYLLVALVLAAYVFGILRSRAAALRALQEEGFFE